MHAQGTQDTQSLYVPDTGHYPFVDREGLMKINLFSIEDGDEERCAISDLTSNDSSIPRSFLYSVQVFIAPTLPPSKSLISSISCTSNALNFFDSIDASLYSYGFCSFLCLDLNTILQGSDTTHTYTITA